LIVVTEDIKIEWEDWVPDSIKDYESVFLKELEIIKGYILEALLWLSKKPNEPHHSVIIRLNIEEEDIDDDYFIDMYFEPDKSVSMSLHQVTIDENIVSHEYIAGWVHFPPTKSLNIKEIHKLRKDVIEFFKSYIE